MTRPPYSRWRPKSISSHCSSASALAPPAGFAHRRRAPAPARDRRRSSTRAPSRCGDTGWPARAPRTGDRRSTPSPCRRRRWRSRSRSRPRASAPPAAPHASVIARLADRHLLPLGGEREVALDPPPDVLAGRVDQLELEVVARRLAAQLEGEGVVLRQRQVDVLAHDDEAAVREVEVDAHRHAGLAGVRDDLDGRALRRRRRPAAQLLEVVEHRLG